MKITYFGFAANPPTLSHAKVIKILSEKYDEVFVGPAAAHAFGKDMRPMDERMRLAEAMLHTVNAPNVTLTNIEESLAEPSEDGHGTKPVYSFTVLQALRSMYPDAEIHLAIGPDNAEPATWERFYRHADIDKYFGKVVVPDMGVTRSTIVRNLLKAGTTVAELIPHVGEEVAHMLINSAYTGEKA